MDEEEVRVGLRNIVKIIIALKQQIFQLENMVKDLRIKLCKKE